MESVTSHGPVDSKRYIELEELFSNVTADKVYISAFPDKKHLRIMHKILHGKQKHELQTIRPI